MNIHRFEFLCITWGGVKYSGGGKPPHSGIGLASSFVMARVEPKDRETRQTQQDRRSVPRRTPGKAEGEERDVEEALRKDEARRRERR